MLCYFCQFFICVVGEAYIRLHMDALFYVLYLSSTEWYTILNLNINIRGLGVSRLDTEFSGVCQVRQILRNLIVF